MSTSKELKSRAKVSLKGKYWNAFAACIIWGLLTSVSAAFGTFSSGAKEIVNFAHSGAIQMDEVIANGAAFISALGTTAFVIEMIFYAFLDGPMSVGAHRFFLINTEEKPSLKELFFGFKNSYLNNMKIMFSAFVKNVLWAFVFIIPGIVKMFEYSIIPYILAGHPEMESKDVFAEAKRLMKGNKMRLFKLELSFIGWVLLCSLTLGIGVFFLVPYYQAAHAEFYKEILDKQ